MIRYNYFNISNCICIYFNVNTFYIISDYLMYLKITMFNQVEE